MRNRVIVNSFTYTIFIRIEKKKLIEKQKIEKEKKIKLEIEEEININNTENINITNFLLLKKKFIYKSHCS